MMLDITAFREAWLFRDHVWKLHGLPEEVISNQGTQFMSNFMLSFSQLLKIRITVSTAYHLQTDGVTSGFLLDFQVLLDNGVIAIVWNTS